MTIVPIPKELLIKNVPVPACWKRDWWEILGKRQDQNACRPSRFYNPSIIRMGGRVWMTYRCDQPKWQPFSWIAAVQLHPEMFFPVWETNKVINLPTVYDGVCAEDPRLFNGSHGECLMSYTDGRRIALARLDGLMCVDDHWYIEAGFKFKDCEKNWAFFNEGRKILAIYQTDPHIVVQFDWDNERPFGQIISETTWGWDKVWKYGQPKGGATPVLHNGVFWHFFHSYVEPREKHREYYAGCYIFEAKPPYRPIAITSNPLIVPQHHAPRPPNFNWDVVFPAGAIRVNEGWAVSYGQNDFDCCIGIIPDSEIKLTKV